MYMVLRIHFVLRELNFRKSIPIFDKKFDKVVNKYEFRKLNI